MVSGTLAEAKAELGHVQALIVAHPGECVTCLDKLGRCDETKALKARAAVLREEIGSWFAPGRDATALFDVEA